MLDIISIENTSNLREVLSSHSAWAVITGQSHDEVALICVEMNLPFLFMDDRIDINEALDNLIDQQAQDIFSRSTTL